MTEPFLLSDTTWKTVRDTKYEVAVLPWGATEAHNFHLPYATDFHEASHIARESARRAWNAGAKVVVLPGIPFGVNTGQLDIRLCINMNPSTQAAVLADVARSLESQGIPKLAILNGHGGELETSVMMHIAPDTLLPLDQAGDGRAKKFRIAGLRDGTAWAMREWSKISPDTGVGNPSRASVEKGRRFLDAVTEKIGGFL